MDEVGILEQIHDELRAIRTLLVLQVPPESEDLAMKSVPHRLRSDVEALFFQRLPLEERMGRTEQMVQEMIEAGVFNPAQGGFPKPSAPAA